MQTYLSFFDWATRNHVGDLAGILGLLLSVVGFGMTLVGLHRARRTAEAARLAAEGAREELRRFETTVDLSDVMRRLDTIKLLQRRKEWHAVVDRYDELTRSLIAIRRRRPLLAPGQQEILQECIVQMQAFGTEAERAMQGLGEQPDTVWMNSVISRQLEKLSDVLAGLEQQPRREK